MSRTYLTRCAAPGAARPGARAGPPARRETLAALAGIVALAVAALPHLVGQVLPAAPAKEAGPGAARTAPAESTPAASAAARETLVGAYGGVSHTLPSAVRFLDPPRTDLTVEGFSWIGRPFKLPPYYGLRAQRRDPGSPLALLFDFTHAKAIAQAEDTARFSGQRNGGPMSPSARVGDVFRHLEFSHGHNMLTLNGLWRMPSWLGKVRPYVGAGAGISLPHTEIGFRGEKERTYEYQLAGGVAQVLAGVEFELGPATVFLEYKLTYAPYSVPLSHEPYGWLLITDLWRQFRAWLAGERPPGGWAATLLLSHHAVAGAYARFAPRAAMP
jgi:hypothetical protein